ncbi:type II secretion system F family protein [Amnibacterium flavum]|uniref:Type II secretion system F family protein n=1 Tax=Amnibacterium flavum TaxID=2173173 RepID=A0A2V1HVS9_9MICO|nr:type II secretion system F family protein [Amnibacterium flavum]PVZ95150.1 type II secretion system F family protein [Amnibacterium flavum]
MSTAVRAWSYRGRDLGGKVVKGKLDAPNEGAVVTRLRGMGLSPIAIEEAAAGTGLNRDIAIPGFEKKVGLKDLAVMSRQMATMVSAGLSLLRTLTILSEQTENKKLAETLADVRNEVEHGASLSTAMSRHAMVFPPLMINLVRAGETGGFLEGALESVAGNFEAEHKLKSTIKSALTYPVVVLSMAVIAVIGMLIFIVPVFKTMFENLGGTLPLPTQMLVWLSEGMQFAAPVLIVVGIAVAVWWGKNKYTDRVRGFVDPLKLKIPVFGMLFKKVAVARFTRNFSTMIAAGVPILQSLSVVGETSGSWVIEQALKRVQESVRAGKSIAGPLSTEPVFPAMVTQMIAVGEDSGSLEQMLAKIADFYDDEVQSTTEALTSLIEPLMIAVIGVVVGGMIVALYLPIFNIFTLIK